jgi:hypothetical protein
MRPTLTAASAKPAMKASLALKGTAGKEPVLAWSPPSPFSFGALAAGTTSAAVVFTLDNTGGPAVLTIAKPGSAFAITPGVRQVLRHQPGDREVMHRQVTYTASATPGQASQATLRTTAESTAAIASETLTGAAALATPAIQTTQQPASAAPNTQVPDKATVTGGFNPSGTVTFTLYSNAACNQQQAVPVFHDTEALAGSSAISADYTPKVPGIYY